MDEPRNTIEPNPDAGTISSALSAPEDLADAKTLHAPTSAAVTCSLASGQRFGEYDLIGEIARGGMGVVYRARHVVLDRIVALKMILAGRLANVEDVQRFHTEAGAAAKLRHPNIVAVHDVGAIDGQHYFTMQFIDGVNLDQLLRDGPLAGKSAARYVRIIASAVHYAHKQGILHRDLKPSNILIDADDHPHISDFGLAKRLGPGDSRQTRTGSVLGTPSYMSPEQAQGRTHELGPASDIYSLGAILYELLTDRPPFRAETPLDTVMQVIDHEPVPPRLLNPNVDHDLETICLKCLEKNPAQRYASAEDLAADLQRYLDGDTISARSVNVLERMARTLERDTHTAAFSGWGNMLLWMALVVFTEHIVVFLLVWFQQDRLLIAAARVMQLSLLAFLFWHNRRGRLLPTTAAERELWTIWIGYFTTYFFVILITRVLSYQSIFENDAPSFKYFRELLPYPFIAILSGLAFFIMGSNYWGRCYAIGAVFFVSGPLIAMNLWFGPLIFGVTWAVILAFLGFHLRKQEAKATQEKAESAPSALEHPTVKYKDSRL